MTSGLVITANFVQNNFPPVAGNYRGLFLDLNPNSFRPENSGAVTIDVGTRGAFTGKLTIGGKTYGFTGAYDPSGAARVSIPRRTQPPIVLSLGIILTEGGNTVFGTVTTSSDANTLSSELLATRSFFSARNPAPQTGTLPFVLQETTDAGTEIFASLTTKITPSGLVEITGTLSDSQRVGVFSHVTDDGAAPFYLSLRQGDEIVIGWLYFGTGGSPVVDGQLLHATPAIPSVIVLDAIPQ
jgi:hypothetical protein